MKIKLRREDGSFETKVVGKDPEKTIENLESDNLMLMEAITDLYEMILSGEGVLPE